MADETPEQRKESFKKFLRFSWMMEGVKLTDEQLEQSVEGMDFTTPPDQNPAVLAYRRAVERERTEGGDLVELYAEERGRIPAAKLN